MKLIKIAVIALLGTTMLVGETACSSMTQTGKGALIGGGGGAALGAGLGAIIGGGKGAGIGSAIGAAVGAGAGALIGRKMDKQQKELEQQLADQATVEQTTDQNGLQAIKVTFDGGILFPTGKYNLNPQAQADLSRFAVNLNNNPGTNVQIYGFTDNTGTPPCTGHSDGRLRGKQRHARRPRTEPPRGNLHHRIARNGAAGRSRHSALTILIEYTEIPEALQNRRASGIFASSCRLCLSDCLTSSYSPRL